MRKTAEKSAEKFFSKSITVKITLVVLIVSVFVNLHPFNEGLAQQIATALITVDGLILGFSILGVTVVIERGFSATRMTAIFEEHLKEFINELKGVEVSDAEKMKEKLTSIFESATADIVSVPIVLFAAMYSLLASLLTAFMLFGVSDTTAADVIFVLAFKIVLSISIFSLILGFHLTIKVLQDLTLRTNRKKISKAFGEAFQRYEQDLKAHTKKE